MWWNLDYEIGEFLQYFLFLWAVNLNEKQILQYCIMLILHRIHNKVISVASAVGSPFHATP